MPEALSFWKQNKKKTLQTTVVAQPLDGLPEAVPRAAEPVFFLLSVGVGAFTYLVP